MNDQQINNAYSVIIVVVSMAIAAVAIHLYYIVRQIIKDAKAEAKNLKK